jgi:hypothetical protein
MWLDTGDKLQWFVKNLATFMVGKKCSKWVALTWAILNSLDAFATHITYMLSSVHTLQKWGMYRNVSLSINFIIFSGTYGFKFINTLWSIILCENCSSMVTRQVQPRHSLPFACNMKIPCDCGIPSLKPKMGYTIVWLSCDKDECRQNVTCPPVLFFCE